MSVMEISHRGKAFMQVAAEAEADLRELLGVPGGYEVLFMQGGASAQFAVVPLNLAGAGSTADYIDTGHWSKKAIAEARRYCSVRVAGDAGGEYRHVPPQRELRIDAHAAYVHYTPNETISGVEFRLRPGHARRPARRRHVLDHPVAADRCVEVRPDLRRRAEEHRSVRLDGGDRAREPHRARPRRDPGGVQLPAGGRRSLAAQHAADIRLVHGGPGVQVAEEERGARRDGGAQPRSRRRPCTRRSTPRRSTAIAVAGRFALMDERDLHIGQPDLDSAFIDEAAAAGLLNLKGHRALGGMRASLYNAMPLAGSAGAGRLHARVRAQTRVRSAHGKP